MANIDYIYIIGQIFGIIAVVLGFISLQMKSAKKLLMIHLFTAIIICIHYLLIGALSAFALNFIAIFRDIVYYNKDKKAFSSKWIPYIFAAVMGVIGAVSWQGFYSLLVIAGLMINTVCLSFSDSQNIRKSILISSPLVLIYNIIVLSFGGIVFESMSIVSSIIGIIRYRKSRSNKFEKVVDK